MADADPMRFQAGPLRTTELIRERAVEAVLGQSGVSHPGLAAEIRRRFGSTDVDAGALVREPVIEGAAPFVSSGRTFADCAGDPLHGDVIRAISSDKAGDYRFPPDAQPYRHQIEAWRHLAAEDRRSVLVSSGTGSGKTECFLMPLLSDLAGEAERSGRLSGVRAIALYPLNALIASQEERLRAWTAPFNGRIRFGLYNGLTPEKVRAGEAGTPEQVRDRETLRRDPPPILVTNVTMLEYMTVRRNDRPLIENSRGQLRWIVLDEAHGYVGSAAAEVALLIRRVLLAYGVRAEDVRFVATSATIGDERDVTDELRRFLRDLSGADESRVHVVLGERDKVLLPQPAGASTLSHEALTRREQLGSNPAVHAFVRAAEEGPVLLQRAERMLAGTGQSADAVIGAVAASGDGQHGPLLPLRIHSFLRAVPGLWSCLNPECGEAPPDWAFGSILTERVDRCPSCRSPVFEVKTCRECGEPYLECEERDGMLHAVTTPVAQDEFATAPDGDGDQDGEAEAAVPVDHSYDPAVLAIATRDFRGWPTVPVEVASGRRPDRSDDRTRNLPLRSADVCGACGAEPNSRGGFLRPLRYGAPFLIGNAAPVLLEGLPESGRGKTAYRPPAGGRQLLSFTDSRQGTARFAANLQTNAERGFVRGFLYHAVQGSMTAKGVDDPEVEALRREIGQLEALRVEALAELIRTKKDALSARLASSVDGIAWTDMRRGLASQPEVMHWMLKVWGAREPDRYGKSAENFAEFLMLRELARRPRRANTAETLGLARLRFDAIDRATAVPAPLREKRRSPEDWQGLLYAILDMTVRANFAIRASWDDVHWLHARTPLSTLLPPGEQRGATREITWPMVKPGRTNPSNLLLILEKSLGLDRSDPQGRAMLNEVLEAAWNALQPLFTSPMQPGYALDFAKARIAPVTSAWQCPVTRRVLSTTALSLTPYGHREGLITAGSPPRPIAFPALPVTFPRGEALEDVRRWLGEDPGVAELRARGIWTDIHDRSALLSPYIRAAEHSAQQPPARLRRFEREFKDGEINILNCSTTMEMGVDIGSVSAVMMTNVPPALANYRQRVGRAGRRGQGFASSLTYTRDTPLDREAFRDPEAYLSRITRAPHVKLDSRRIVQRHVNALLLAKWFAGTGGEVMKTRVGDFFGLPDVLGAVPLGDAPVATCLAWLQAPSTRAGLASDVEALTRGTVLEGDRTLAEAAHQCLDEARIALGREWDAIQQQASSAPAEGRASLRYQLERLARENLLKELVVRAVLPGHGFPTAVVSFINDDRPSVDERGDDDASRRRRSFPTRNLDIAIRDYAPGAEVVVDGLVYRSAGVTLNWLRPADDTEAREIQSLKVFWSCAHCGAADCARVAPAHCPACHGDVPLERQRRFLEPAGFTADMRAKPHAETDEVMFVEPEAEQIVARGAAWIPLADPVLGRIRESHDGLVFYSSRGPSRRGYHVCLECGRAAPGGQPGDTHPLVGHEPLRFTKRNASGLCPGNDKPFKITVPVALGHQTVTDVAELQPVGLEAEGAAWAAASAIREALARRLGVEVGELGIAVRAVTTALGQRTHSLFLFDRASGGAGFAPQAVRQFDVLLADAERILDCRQPGCVTGCSNCVLAPDLQRQQELIDRRPALQWIESARSSLAHVPEVDRATPDATLSRSAVDEISERIDSVRPEVSIWAGPVLDVAELSSDPLLHLARRIADRGGRLDLFVDPAWLKATDPAARLALRDAAKAGPFRIRQAPPPQLGNGASILAEVGADRSTFWASRDPEAGILGSGWGQGATAPVVRGVGSHRPSVPEIDLDSLLPASGTVFMEVGGELDGSIRDFGPAFASKLLPGIRAAAGSTPLVRMAYNDRYLQSPLVVRLMTETLSSLRDALAPNATVPVTVTTNRLKANERQPFAPDHDWQWGEDREHVLMSLLGGRDLIPKLVEHGASHGRVLTLDFEGGSSVRVVLDQGFGPWRTPRFARFDFGEEADRQAEKIGSLNALVDARGPSYVVVID